MLFPGLCQAVVNACFGPRGHDLILSEHILREFQMHGVAKFKAPPEEVLRAVEFIRDHAELIEPAEVPPGACRDPDDLPVLGTALAAKADFLVTGDAHLLELGEFQGIPIVTPRGFCERTR
jgi:putative PIN family toxin of toxin-antitoxin system